MIDHGRQLSPQSFHFLVADEEAPGQEPPITAKSRASCAPVDICDSIEERAAKKTHNHAGMHSDTHMHA